MEEEEDDEYAGAKTLKPNPARVEELVEEEGSCSPSPIHIEPYKPLEPGKFYIEKKIFIVSRNPFFEQFELLLLDLYQMMTKDGLKAPLEDYLVALLFELPAPPRGI